jgi:hypothetical protein
MKKIYKYSLLTLAVLTGLLILLSLGGWIYLRKHKAEIIRYVKIESAKNFDGDLSIGNISASLFHTFPKVSVEVGDVRLRDNRWSEHHHDLLYARKAYASLDIFQLITGRLRLSKIILENASVYIYKDSSGYSNTSVFKKKIPSREANTAEKHYPNLELRNASLIVEKRDKNKFFSFDISRLLCKIKTSADQPALDLDINLSLRVKSLLFNPEKGSFVAGKTVQGRFKARFNPQSKILEFDRIKLEIDKQSFTASGKFFLAEAPALFTVSLNTENLPFKKTLAFLSQNIQSKLSLYDVSDAIGSLKCTLDATDTGYRTPLIHVMVNVTNKSVHTPLTDLEKTSFTGSFTNESVKGRGHDDENSILRFTGVDGTWQKIQFHADSLIIRNLIHPRMSCNIKSGFRLEALNDFFADETILFRKGSGNINLRYSGPITRETDIPKNLNGILLLDSAAFTYLPRDFEMVNGNGKIRFSGPDMFIDDLHVNTGTTDLLMNGSMKNLFSLMDKDDRQIHLDWNIRSNKINGNDFRSFLKKRSGKVTVKKKKVLLSETLSHISRILETSSMELNVRAGQFMYKKFSATDLRASIALDDDAINIKNIQLKHAGGAIEAHGALRNEASSNPFSFKATLVQLDLAKVLDAFSNFGQKAINSQNIQGVLSADMNLQGEVTQKLQLIPDSTRGQIDFNLQQGRLIHFEPLQKISQTVFKNRNFSDIRFADLHDLFVVKGNLITINRMEIRSTLITMFVEGEYDMKKGADLSIQVPLSNLKNQTADHLPENRGIHSKTGPSAMLRAKNGDDGKLKISWDPFKKAVRKMKKNK